MMKLFLLVFSFFFFGLSLARAEPGYRLIIPDAHEKALSVDLVDADLQDVLKALAEVENANIAFQRDVGGKLRSLQVRGVPTSTVFDIILKTHGLYAESVGDVIIVSPIEEFIKDAKARKALHPDW